MKKSIFEKWTEERRQKWLSHVRHEILALSQRGTPITLAEWKELRLNSYEHEELYPHLDNEALLHVIQHTLDRCSMDRHGWPCATYDQALQVIFMPMLIARFKQQEESYQRQVADLENRLTDVLFRHGILE